MKDLLDWKMRLLLAFAVLALSFAAYSIFESKQQTRALRQRAAQAVQIKRDVPVMRVEHVQIPFRVVTVAAKDNPQGFSADQLRRIKAAGLDPSKPVHKVSVTK